MKIPNVPRPYKRCGRKRSPTQDILPSSNPKKPKAPSTLSSVNVGEGWDHWLMHNQVSTKVDFSRFGLGETEIAKEFNRITCLVGVDAYSTIRSKAWQCFCYFLGACNELFILESIFEDGSLKELQLVSVWALRTAIVGCVALAVDLVGDFHATCVVSAVAWAHLLRMEICRTFSKTHVPSDNISTDSARLMQAKLRIASKLNWNLMRPTGAEALASNLKILFELLIPDAERDNLILFSEELLHLVSQHVIPRSMDPTRLGTVIVVIAILTFDPKIAFVKPKNAAECENWLRELMHVVRRKLSQKKFTGALLVLERAEEAISFLRSCSNLRGVRSMAAAFISPDSAPCIIHQIEAMYLNI